MTNNYLCGILSCHSTCVSLDIYNVFMLNYILRLDVGSSILKSCNLPLVIEKLIISSVSVYRLNMFVWKETQFFIILGWGGGTRKDVFVFCSVSMYINIYTHYPFPLSVENSIKMSTLWYWWKTTRFGTWDIRLQILFLIPFSAHEVTEWSWDMFPGLAASSSSWHSVWQFTGRKKQKDGCWREMCTFSWRIL